MYVDVGKKPREFAGNNTKTNVLVVGRTESGGIVLQDVSKTIEQLNSGPDIWDSPSFHCPGRKELS